MRTASACRGFTITLYVSGTKTDRTSNTADSPSRSQRSPHARVTETRRDQSVGSCASSADCFGTSSGISSSMNRWRVSALGSRTWLCTRISSTAVAGFAAQYKISLPRVCHRADANRPPRPSRVSYREKRQTITSGEHAVFNSHQQLLDGKGAEFRRQYLQRRSIAQRGFRFPHPFSRII
jgi:hypothetical protein